jgi:hypothetical protein
MINVDYDGSHMKTNRDWDGASILFESCQLPAFMETHHIMQKKIVSPNKDSHKEVAIGSY